MNKEFSKFLYFFGSFIPFFVLFSHFNIVQEPLLVYFSILIISVFVLFINMSEKFRIAKNLVLILLLVICVLNYQGIIQAFVQIFNAVVKEYNKYEGINIALINIHMDKNMIFLNVSLLILLIQYLYTNVLISFMNKKKYGTIFIISLIFGLPVLLVQIELNWFSWILMISYWASIYIYNQFKYTINITKFFKVSLFTISILAITSTVFIMNFSEYKLKAIYKPVTISQELMDKLNELIQKYSDLQVNNNEIDLSYARNRVYLDTVHLAVETDHVQPYYLKYYSGALYSDNKWLPLDELDIERAKLKDEDYDYAYKYIKRYTLNPYDVDTITIHDKRKGNTFSIYPYYIRTVDQDYEMYRDMYMMYDSNSATFQTWDTSIVTYSIDHALKYKEFVNENYLFVPLNIQTLFKSKLNLEQQDYSGVRTELAKSKILELLSEYTYTLSPGGTPTDKDFVEYFLMDNKKGYCVHFASAATLMFRYYGIPARYVEGYYVSPSQFKDGKAEVLDSDAHAWVEIYDTYLGWMPIEVTVGQDEVETDDEPITPNTPNRPNNQQNVNQQNNPQNNTILPTVPIGENGEYDVKQFVLKYAYCFVVILLFAIYFVVRMIRIRIRKNNINQENRKQSIFAMYNYLEKINCYSSVFTDEMIQLFEKNKYSKQGLNDQEYDMLRKNINEIPKIVYKTLKWSQKVKYKYIDCLI